MLQGLKDKLTGRNGDQLDGESDGANTTDGSETSGARRERTWGTNAGLTPDEFPDAADVAVTPVSASSVQLLVRGARVGETFCKVMYIPRGGWPPEPAPGLLDRLTAHSSAGVQVKLRIDPMDRDRAVSEFKRRVSEKNKELYAKQQTSAPDASVVADEKKELDNVLRSIKGGSETVYWVGCYFVIRAPTKRQVDDAADEIERDLGKDDLDVTSTDWVQADGMTTVSPVGSLALPETTRTPMTGSALGCLYPFSTSSMIEEGGILYGRHALNGSPVFVDRWGRESGHNKLVIAKIRSGKTFGEKLDITREMAEKPDLRTVAIDPRGGFQSLVEAFGDDAETITVGGKVGINPLHIEPTPSEILRESPDLDPYGQKHSFALSFLETAVSSGGGDLDSGTNEVSAIERAVLSESLTRGYASVGITSDPNTHSRESPLISDVRTVLGALSDDPAAVLDEELTDREVTKWSGTASDLKMALRPFAAGGNLDHFNEPTKSKFGTDDNGKRLVVLDLQQSEASGNLPLDMKVYLGSLYEAAKRPGEMRVTADEIHHMMDTPTGLKWFESAFRYSGHFDLGITAITQTADEFFVNERAKTIADLCSIKQFYKTPGLTDEHGEMLGLSPREIRFVRTATPGDRTRGYAHALLAVDDKPNIPIRVEAISERELNVVDPVGGAGGSAAVAGAAVADGNGGRF